MDTFQAIADPTRRHIIEMLAQKGKLSATDISSKFHSSPPAISQHLKILRDAEIVQVEKKAQQRIYTINPQKVTELEKWIHHLKKTWEARFDRLEKVLEIEKKKQRMR